jgi:hypothetical protein
MIANVKSVGQPIVLKANHAATEFQAAFRGRGLSGYLLETTLQWREAAERSQSAHLIGLSEPPVPLNLQDEHRLIRQLCSQ